MGSCGDRPVMSDFLGERRASHPPSREGWKSHGGGFHTRWGFSPRIEGSEGLSPAWTPWLADDDEHITSEMINGTMESPMARPSHIAGMKTRPQIAPMITDEEKNPGPSVESVAIFEEACWRTLAFSAPRR
ncbi:MAG: hypothetical protein D6723_02480 [Acidobacteria bacterium]|nr:MAG: hypothetical protein D6723_02480 [Acidobacteriota bacterium]